MKTEQTAAPMERQILIKNIGAKERWMRVGIGLTALAAGLVFRSWWGLLGLIPLGVAAIGACPLYFRRLKKHS